MIAFNKLEKTELLEMEDVFLKSFKFINNSGDEFPFSKYKASVVELTGEIILERMSKFNAAVYDSLIVSSKYAMEKQDSLDIKNFRELFKDTEFFSSVEGSVNDVSKLNIRIQKAILVLC